MKITTGKDFAIEAALKPTSQNFAEGSAVSDGNMVVGISTDFRLKTVAIAFNNTVYNQNTLVVLTVEDAKILKTLLTTILPA